MSKVESLEDFYKQKFNWLPENLKKDIGHFNVFRLEDCINSPVKYTRRDYYKITLLRGNFLYHYADKSIEVTGTTLIFFKPDVPYKFEQLSEDAYGYFCIFKEAFFTEHLRGSIKDLPMYAVGGKPAYQLNKAEDKYVSNVYEKMLSEIASDYAFKYDLLRNHVTELIHFAMKLEPAERPYHHRRRTLDRRQR